MLLYRRAARSAGLSLRKPCICVMGCGWKRVRLVGLWMWWSLNGTQLLNHTMIDRLTIRYNIKRYSRSARVGVIEHSLQTQRREALKSIVGARCSSCRLWMVYSCGIRVMPGYDGRLW